MSEVLLGNANQKSFNLLWYPGVLLLVYLPAMINGLIRSIVSNQDVLIASQAVKISIYHSLGLLNAIVYGFHRRIHKRNEAETSMKSSLESSRDEGNLTFEFVERKSHS